MSNIIRPRIKLTDSEMKALEKLANTTNRGVSNLVELIVINAARTSMNGHSHMDITYGRIIKLSNKLEKPTP